MADSDCSTTKFICVCKNAYYFEGPQCATEDEPDKRIEEDRFQASKTSVKLLRCYDNKFLILSYNGLFEKLELTAQGQHCPDNKFCLQFYNSDDLRKGIPVMLYAIKSDKKLVACCNGSDGIYPEEMEIKNFIEESKHKALFYMIKQEGSNKYMFESSLYENKYLGLEPDKSEPSVVKLVLRMYDPDNHNDALSPE
uniref:Interleukin-18 n=2 Tax=Sphaeramia orbicularis TaxID=375764 RepID=A0A673C3C7_9TELE